MKGGAPFGTPSFNRTTCNGYAFRAPTSVCWMQSTLRHKCCLGSSNSISLFCCYLGIIWHFLLHFIHLPSCGYFFYISAFAFLFFLFFSLFLFQPFNFFHCSRQDWWSDICLIPSPHKACLRYFWSWQVISCRQMPTNIFFFDTAFQKFKQLGMEKSIDLAFFEFEYTILCWLWYYVKLW